MKLLIVLSVVLIFLALPVLAFAEEEEQKEEITLTTYYPAPYGDYTDLTVDTLHLNPRTDTPTVWDASGHSGAPGELAYAEGDGKLYYSNGSVWVAEAGGGGGGGCYVSYSGGCLTDLGFTNKGSAGGWGFCANIGYYTGPNSHFRPAGGGCYSGSSYNIGEAYVCGGGGGGGGCYVSYSGSCPTGFTNKGSAGGWGFCAYYSYYSGNNSHFRPAGGGCYSGWSSYNIGEAYVCCQNNV